MNPHPTQVMPRAVPNGEGPPPQTGAGSPRKPTMTTMAVNRNSARSSLPMHREEGGDSIAAPTNFLSAFPSFGTLLARKAFAAIRQLAPSSETDAHEPAVTLACSFVHDGCLDLSHLNRRDQVELCGVRHWSILYAQASSLGHPITKLSLPPENILCKDKFLFSKDDALPALDRGLLARLLEHLQGGVLVEYGEVGARELLRISRCTGTDRAAKARRNLHNDVIVAAEDNTDFLDLMWARECLKKGNAFDAGLDTLSAVQWQEAIQSSVEAFKHLLAMPVTRANEEKFFLLLTLLANHDNWSRCDDPCRDEWRKGCEEVANTFDAWKQSTGLPTDWQRWGERSKTLRKLLQDRTVDTRKSRRALSPRVLASPSKLTGTVAKATETRRRAVQVTKDAQTAWRSKLVECCLRDPVDATPLLALLEELVESPGWKPAHKQDLLQEEFNGKTLLEHLGDASTDEFFLLFERLQ